jgi:flavin reductase (DIM6/NTAB) family NADH-FMN oxidoreductase RutF
MSKQNWKPSTLLNPVPLVMVTTTDMEGKANIITLAWAGTINSEPPMLSISVRKERHSYEAIKKKGDFVVNLVTTDLIKSADFCGVKSGKDVDKFKSLGLTQEKAQCVNAPLIAESPINIECKVVKCISLGSHDMFLAEIKAINVDDKVLDEKGKLCMKQAGLVCYSHGEYFQLGKALGYFGYSVTKKKSTYKKRMKK